MARHLDVRFQYRKPELTGAEKNELTAAQLDAAALAVLPAKFLLELRDAVEGGEGEQAHTLIAAVPEVHAAVGSALAQMVDEYRFDQLVDLIQAAMKGVK